MPWPWPYPVGTLLVQLEQEGLAALSLLGRAPGLGFGGFLAAPLISCSKNQQTPHVYSE